MDGRREGNIETIMKDPPLLYPAAAINGCPEGHNEAFTDALKQLMKEVHTYIADRGYEINAGIQFSTFEVGLREMELCGVR